jgi:hypothetical protein
MGERSISKLSSSANNDELHDVMWILQLINSLSLLLSLSIEYIKKFSSNACKSDCHDAMLGNSVRNLRFFNFQLRSIDSRSRLIVNNRNLELWGYIRVPTVWHCETFNTYFIFFRVWTFHSRDISSPWSFSVSLHLRVHGLVRKTAFDNFRLRRKNPKVFSS